MDTKNKEVAELEVEWVDVDTLFPNPANPRVNDAAVDGSAVTVWLSAMRLRLIQTGRMPNYGMAMALGVFALALIWWVVQT